jgi:hypothetical protein
LLLARTFLQPFSNPKEKSKRFFSLPWSQKIFPTLEISSESGAFGSSQQLSCLNQAEFPSFYQEKPRLGKYQCHEKIIVSKSDSSQNSKQFLSVSQLNSSSNRADISKTQPLHYNKALKSDVNLKV